MIPPVVAIAIVLVVLGGLMLAVRTAQRRFAWEPELSRKSVHVLMGLICCTFPWLFRDAWAVWLLGVGAVLALGAIRILPQANLRFGKVLSGVERESWGELLFPIAVAFVFWLARGNKLLFCIPVLILSLADATAALVGRRYGVARYQTDDGSKTMEGSAAFFVVAFVSTALPLALFSSVNRTNSFVIAGVMGFILVLIEAIAWRGLDNLFIPVVSYVCLARMLKLPLDALGIRLVVLLAVIFGCSFWRKATRLTQSAVIGAALILYVSWAVEGWHWMIAPLVTAAGYTYLCRKPAVEPHQHSVHAIASIGGIGLFWLCLSHEMGRANAVYPYGIAYAANLGMIAVPCFASSGPGGAIGAIFKATALSFALMVFPYLVVWRSDSALFRLTGAGVVLLGAAITAFAVWQPSVESSPTNGGRWMRQAVISATASAFAFGIILYLEP